MGIEEGDMGLSLCSKRNNGYILANGLVFRLRGFLHINNGIITTLLDIYWDMVYNSTSENGYYGKNRGRLLRLR